MFFFTILFITLFIIRFIYKLSDLIWIQSLITPNFKIVLIIIIVYYKISSVSYQISINFFIIFFCLIFYLYSKHLIFNHFVFMSSCLCRFVFILLLFQKEICWPSSNKISIHEVLCIFIAYTYFIRINTFIILFIFIFGYIFWGALGCHIYGSVYVFTSVFHFCDVYVHLDCPYKAGICSFMSVPILILNVFLKYIRTFEVLFFLSQNICNCRIERLKHFDLMSMLSAWKKCQTCSKYTSKQSRYRIVCLLAGTNERVE